MSTRNPFEELERFFDRLGHQFEETSEAWTPDGPFGGWSSAFESMAVDVVETDAEFVVSVDLPGFDRDAVDVRVTDHTLRIDAEREERTEDEAERYLRRERRSEASHRSIQLPDDVDPDGVTARMNNGVLTVTLPKVEVEAARTVDIE